MNDLEWKILTIDNIPSFNEIIEIIADRLSFKNRKLSVLKANSLEEGKEILGQNSDIALVLVDIMMEDKKSGLDFIKFVRNDLKNQESRIILRTGYPDSLPEKNIIHNYEIDGYISKEVNSQLQIEVAIITAIRSYYQILSTRETLQSLAGSIVHELRNPLNAINLSQNEIQELILNSTNGDKDLEEKLNNLSIVTTESVVQANHIINIILNDLSEKPINPSEFSYLKPSKILPEIIEKYGYQNEQEREKIKLDLPENDILFKAVPDRFIFIIYNLLKNAFYYLKQYPNSCITIGNDIRSFGQKSFNVIYVYDTGPGIHPEIMSKLFDDFYTSGKKGGTGLGLPFCKRNMKLFGGDIICESEFGNGDSGWSKFSLLFPLIEKEEENQIIFNKKQRILLLGNQEHFLGCVSKIKEGLNHISCDVAENKEDALNILQKKDYQIILVDIETPELSNYEFIEKVISHNKEVPIIAFTSLNRRAFLDKIKNEFKINIFNGYLSKSYCGNIFYRGITKWITDIEDDFSYLLKDEKYLENLKGKKILLVDDEKVNRILTKNILESYGVITTEAKDGKDLLKIFRNSLNDNKSEFDLILTDINMPTFNGDKAAQEIRKIEVINNIHQDNEIPIIALSGDGNKDDIYSFFDSQITDYFIKGSSTELLLKILANYL